MEASIKEPNIRNFVRLLQCASRFGDDLNMHANKDMWELAVTNSSKSAFCLFKLKPKFFCRFRALGDTNVERRKGVKCQLLVKSVLAVLGKASSVSNVERVDLTIVDPDRSLRKRRKTAESQTLREGTDDYNAEEEELGGIEAKLILKLVCKHGVTKKHSLHLGTTEFLRAEVDPRSTPSSFAISARALRDMLDHFSLATGSGFGSGSGGFRSENQLGWMLSRNEVRMKSWEGGQSSLSTEIKVDVGEFEDYWVEDERVDLTVPMKEFRAALTLAEQLGIRLAIAYSTPTQPLTITTAADEDDEDENPAFDIFCAIATTVCDAFSDIPMVERKPSRSATVSVPPGGDTPAPNTSTTGVGTTSTPQTSKRKRATLSMSHERPPASTPAVLNITAASAPAPQISRVDETTLNGESETAEESEPLFLPNSQGAPLSQVADEERFMPQSQSMRLTQQEVLEMSGFGEIDPNQLMDELDDAEEEDELENAAIIAAQGGMVMDQTIPLASTLPPRQDVELNFEPDDGIFGHDDTAMEDTREDTTANTTAHTTAATTTDTGEGTSEDTSRAEDTTTFGDETRVSGQAEERTVQDEVTTDQKDEDEEMGEDEFDSTQGRGNFRSFFED